MAPVPALAEWENRAWPLFLWTLFLQYRPLAEYQPGYDGLPVGGKGLPPSTAAQIPQNTGRTAQPFEWATRRSRVGTAEATAPLAPSKAARRNGVAPPRAMLRGSKAENRAWLLSRKDYEYETTKPKTMKNPTQIPEAPKKEGPPLQGGLRTS